MNNYRIALKGDTDRMVKFLTDLLENQNSPLNYYPGFKLKDINWTATTPDTSAVVAELSIDAKAIKKSDADIIREDYKVSFGSKRLVND